MKLIQQQYYTRSKRGVYLNGEGYDTIAVSKNLTQSFVKEYIHPICFYEIPNELELKKEDEKDNFPKILTCINIPSGEMIIGQSTYPTCQLKSDRNVFFSHNFVLPENIKEKFIKNIDNILFLDCFKESYDISKGQELPELDDLKVKPVNDILSNFNSILSELDIERKVFKDILLSIFVSIFNKKKVFISLDKKIEKQTEYSKILLRCILCCLPYAYRRYIGFRTFLKEITSRQFIHINFIDKGSVKFYKQELKDNIFFDFLRGNLFSSNEEIDKSIFIDYILGSVTSGLSPENFFEFIDTFQLKNKDLLSLNLYNQLFSYYQIESGEKTLYFQNKTDIYSGLDDVINKTIGKSNKIDELVENLIDIEIENLKINNKNFVESDTLSFFIKYFKENDSETIKEKLSSLVINQINNLIYNEKHENVDKILEDLYLNHDLFKIVVIDLLDSNLVKLVLSKFLAKRLLSVGSLGELLNEINIWRNISSRVFAMDSTKDSLKAKVLNLFSINQNYLYKFDQFESFLYLLHKKLPEEENFLIELENELKEFVFHKNAVSDEFDESFIRHLPKIKEGYSNENYRIAKALQIILFGEISELSFLDLTTEELNKASEIAREDYFKIENNPDSFSRVIFMFEKKSSFGTSNTLYYDINFSTAAVVEYVKRKSDNNTLHSFLSWLFNKYSSGYVFKRELKIYLANESDVLNILKKAKIIRENKNFSIFLKKTFRATKDKNIKRINFKKVLILSAVLVVLLIAIIFTILFYPKIVDRLVIEELNSFEIADILNESRYLDGGKIMLRVEGDKYSIEGLNKSSYKISISKIESENLKRKYDFTTVEKKNIDDIYNYNSDLYIFEIVSENKDETGFNFIEKIEIYFKVEANTDNLSIVKLDNETLTWGKMTTEVDKNDYAYTSFLENFSNLKLFMISPIENMND